MQIHEAGVVHGSLYRRSVAINENGRLMVLDFGGSIGDHDCPGPGSCSELRLVRDDLRIQEEVEP